MLRFMIFSTLPLVLAGCAGKSLAPGSLPTGAMGGIYTDVDMQVVAECIAAASGGVSQAVEGRIVISSVRNRGTTYSVASNPDSTVYRTQIAITGAESDAGERNAVISCTNSAPNGRS